MNGAVPCLCAPSNVLFYAEKCAPPPTHTFLKWRFLADFKKYTHTPPPPYVMTCLHMEAKLVENAEKCQNPQSWHVMNVPERYVKGCRSENCQHGKMKPGWRQSYLCYKPTSVLAPFASAEHHWTQASWVRFRSAPHFLLRPITFRNSSGMGIHGSAELMGPPT